ncbi:transcription antitermination factor NusB [Tunturiibacter empetritectus]|uniref:16S rRNA (Cytosine967-C5)-methyltransferase n=1 Tax=Tunturiibacter lichenicola TaxID=2051959 RepID=A0A852VHV3_9BACT|nr:transcription antitermination factor NusB [Edaphobacter lichenicola]NYF90659.1 16S rRNA (cytosine967-C5)-methyltransferase [Edaphobacter lichenicola]
MKKQGAGLRDQGVDGTAKVGPARKRPVSAGPTASVEAAVAKITPARLAAFEILKLVGENKGHSDELLHSARVDGLSPEDRNLTTALVMGVLRWQIALDARVRGLLQRPEQRLAEPVAIALRLGAFQLLHLDKIPAHAALSESVELCRAAGEPHATGMVNAVLRKLAAKPTSQNRDVGHPDLRSGRTVPLHESVAAFAERLGHPRWLVERWVAAYGREAALMICEADQREPAKGGMFVERGGDWPVMDDGSRLVAEIAAAAMPEAKRVWDCCAAPGGKTLILAKRLGSAEIVASDVSAKRLAQTEARLRRYAYAERVGFSVADAADAKSVTGEFDLILCDVPCSGTGTMAGNPEIRHRLKVEEFVRQAERQRSILTGALKRLAPGGRLVYSTCSLEAEECEGVVDAVVGAGGVVRVPVDGVMVERGVLSGEMGSAVRDGALRTLPGVHGGDGFYAVILERA